MARQFLGIPPKIDRSIERKGGLKLVGSGKAVDNTVTSTTFGWNTTSTPFGWSTSNFPTGWDFGGPASIQWMVLSDAELKSKIKEAVAEMFAELFVKEDGLVPGPDAKKQGGVGSSESV